MNLFPYSRRIVVVGSSRLVGVDVEEEGAGNVVYRLVEVVVCILALAVGLTCRRVKLSQLVLFKFFFFPSWSPLLIMSSTPVSSTSTVQGAGCSPAPPSAPPTRAGAQSGGSSLGTFGVCMHPAPPNEI